MSSGSNWKNDIIILNDDDRQQLNRSSSKGNQLKWKRGNQWYKADYTGYEGLAEYVISHLLAFSNLSSDEYVIYEPIQIRYHEKVMNGVSSMDFMKPGWQMITVERLYRNLTGTSLSSALWKIGSTEERLQFLISAIERTTGLKEFGPYLSKVVTIDALFLNEDRHLHNLAVLMDEKGHFDYCPIFDQGAGLLADTTLDYPLGADPVKLIKQVQAKTVSSSFDEQLDACEVLYGRQLTFGFTEKDVRILLDTVEQYPLETRERVLTVVLAQKHKYQYLFG